MEQIALRVPQACARAPSLRGASGIGASRSVGFAQELKRQWRNLRNLLH